MTAGDGTPAPADGTPDGVRSTDVAIVGMACRLPGARTVDEFWDNLRNGVESIRTLSEEDLERAGTPASLREDPDHVPREGVLEDADMFDADFFGLSPRDAAIMDPQHRQFLECAWEALEDASHPPESFAGRVGVFAGSGMQTYLMNNLLTNPSLMRDGGMFLVRHTGNDKDFLATRASYQFDLRGPSLNVQTACSTSLVAVHLGCESLIGGECDMALAGGVTVDVPQGQGYLYREGAIFSPDGRCRSFDAGAGGTVAGSGVGVVVLRRLEDALADGDHVHAVIRGSAVNNDGAGKVGFLAPGVDGQADAVAEALAIAGVEPETVGYVEAHGTATPMGDPIEVEGLTRGFRLGSDRRATCALGSVKSNIGHTDAAAGVAGLMKAALSVEHGEIPPSLHFREPNPEIDFDASPFYVNDSLRTWERQGSTPRRAGVNSLGVGGTNAHVVLEEPPEREGPGATRSRQLLTLSARTPEALERATDRLASHLERHPGLKLPDVAYTLQAGRRRFSCRRTLVCEGVEEAAESLRRRTGRFLATRTDGGSGRPVAWMLSGQGSQHPGMGRELYQEEPAFREAVDRCARILEPELGFDLRGALFAEDEDGEAAERLRHTAVTQPAVFTVEVALARLWRSFGLEPAALIGHSLGEITAACLAGVFSLEDALRLVTARGRLMGELPGGSMLAVPVPEERLAPFLDGETVLAVVNAPDLCVASGPHEAVDRLEERLASEGVQASRLRTSHAFHSSMMDPAVDAFEAEVRAADLEAPSVPLVSNVTGTWMTDEQATDPGYWARHIREAVRFSDGLGTLLTDTDAALLEVGPGTTLRSLARRHPDREPDRPLEASLPHPDDDVPEGDVLMGALGGLWRAGAEVDWEGVHGAGRPRRVRLPTYPFEHERYWIEPGEARSDGAGTAFHLPADEEDGEDALRRRDEVDDWLYRPAWRSAPLPRPGGDGEAEERRVLVLADGEGIGDAVGDRLEERGCRVIRARAGGGFEQTPDGGYLLDPSSPGDYGRLLRRLREEDLAPDHVVHCWSLAGAGGGSGAAGAGASASDDVAPDAAPDAEGLEAAGLEERLDRSFYSLLHLGRALAEVGAADAVGVTVVSRGAQAAGGAPEDPVSASLMGPVRVMGRELPDVACRCVDVAVPEPGSWRRGRLADRLAAEVLDAGDEPVVAYRGADRLVQRFEPVEPGSGAGGAGGFREEGVYLVTGGLGGLGRVLAEHLGRTYRARLALVSRSGLPPRDEWDAWLARHGEDDATSRGIRTVRRVEEAGGEVRVVEADVTDPEAVRRAVEEVRDAFGRIHGAFHLAGHLDDGLMQLKDRDGAAAVLAPKVRGALVLEEALRDVVEDFLVLYSSLSAVLGPTGQVDYAAANAFLDAFAARRSETGRVPVISVGWGTWKEIGMSAASAEADDAGEAAEHPLLGRRTRPSDDEVEFVGHLDPSRHWIVDEHRTRDGTPVLPGTGYLELARAAVGSDGSKGALELRDVLFTAPWTIRNGGGREIRVAVRRDGSGTTFVVRSPAGESRNGHGPWIEHARGSARAADGRRADALPLEAIRRRCDRDAVVLDGAFFHEGLRLGPRWGNIRRIDLGEDEALVEVELPEDFRRELEDYRLHPAIMDSALGAGQALLSRGGEDDAFYFPVSLDAIRVHAALEPEAFSHVRRRTDTGTEDPVFDVTVTDRDGTVLVEAEGFRMRRAEGGAVLSGASTDATGGEASGPTAPGRDGDGRPGRSAGGGARDGAAEIFELARREGITPGEGMEALERILGSLPLPHVVVSPLELDALRRRMRSADRPAGAGEAQDAESSPEAAAHGRPSDLSSSYEAPRSELEETIAAAWEEHLGIAGLGIHDDFFELGGHSLLLSQIAARLQKEIGGQIPLTRLFDDPTIAGWARMVEESDDDGGGASMKEVSRASREKYRVEGS